MTTESDDYFDALTPKQKKAELAKFMRAQKKVEKTIKSTAADVAAFVRSHASMVTGMRLDECQMGAGQISRAVFHIEMDADSFSRFMATRQRGKE